MAIGQFVRTTFGRESHHRLATMFKCSSEIYSFQRQHAHASPTCQWEGSGPRSLVSVDSLFGITWFFTTTIRISLHSFQTAAPLIYKQSSQIGPSFYIQEDSWLSNFTIRFCWLWNVEIRRKLVCSSALLQSNPYCTNVSRECGISNCSVGMKMRTEKLSPWKRLYSLQKICMTWLAVQHDRFSFYCPTSLSN
jgi:hypothetical protein